MVLRGLKRNAPVVHGGTVGTVSAMGSRHSFVNDFVNNHLDGAEGALGFLAGRVVLLEGS